MSKDISRRSFLGIVGGAAAVAGLAACSGDEGGDAQGGGEGTR